MVDFSRLVTDIESKGISQEEIAQENKCKVGRISRLKTGMTPEPTYSLGVSLIAYHKIIMKQKEVPGITYSEKLQDIRRTGISDIAGSKLTGYSVVHYSSMRRAEKNSKGKARSPIGEGAKKINELYEKRKDMPFKSLRCGRKSKKEYIINVIGGFQACSLTQ